MKHFPIPVVAAVVGPGSQPEDDTLDYLTMPQGMDTFRPPVLPEPGQTAGRERAVSALRAALAALQAVRAEGPRAVNRSVDLRGLPAADLALVNQVMGEGEVSAVVQAAQAGGPQVRIQESVYAGVWRVLRTEAGVVVADTLEVGAVPQLLRDAARDDVAAEPPPWAGALPPGVQNAPALLAEIADHWRNWQPGDPPHVVNLTLLPVTPADIGFLDHHLGTGRVLILSRGYGNCRIVNTQRPNCWRVVYYNSQDAVILNTVEVCALPEVALAAPEDLADTHERLAEVLAWVEGA